MITIYLVYFDLFDFNGDGKIDPGDLLLFLEVIDQNEESLPFLNQNSLNVQYLEDKYKLEFVKNKIVDNLFSELISHKKRTFITFHVFRDLMLETSIDKTCSIYFQEDD